MSRAIPRHLPVVVGLALAVGPLAPPGPARAEAGSWAIRLGASTADVSGHDPHVLTQGAPGSGRASRLRTRGSESADFGLRWDRGGRWDFGVDVFFLTVPQELSVPPASGDAGAAARFAITERQFVSSEPSRTLFFERLGDTDMNVWTADLVARRKLWERSTGALRLVLGLRNADFDNDNHFAAGVVDEGGARLDASSNYSRMMGPLAGLALDRRVGRHRFDVGLVAAVVAGDAELSATLSDFTGPFVDAEDAENVVDRRTFRREESVTVTMADLRLEWRYPAEARFRLLAGLGVASWSGVSVPPGVRPTGTLETTYEESITLTRGLVGVEIEP